MHTARISILLLLICLIAPPLLAQDGGPLVPPEEPTFPPEPPRIPPEPPLEDCGFYYMGYTQTSQGVLQDDPLDNDFLQVVKGRTALRPDLASAPEAFAHSPLQYQVPTFEAGIDMVAGRESYLLGADPYFPGDLENFVEFFNLKGWTNFSQGVEVQLRATVVLNGRVLKQFLISDADRPKTVLLEGPCGGAQPTLGSSLLYRQDVLARARPYLGSNSAAIKFLFDEPGRYLVRTELVRHDPLLRHNAALLAPLGVAVDVRGEVIETQGPSLLVLPLVGRHKDHDMFADLVETYLVPEVRQNLQFGLAMPSEPGDVRFASSEALSGTLLSYPAITALLQMTKRYSAVLRQPDRIVVVAEADEFVRFLPALLFLSDGTLGLHQPMNKSILFVKGPELISNSLGYIPPLLPVSQRVSDTFLHELLHSFGDWSPDSAAEMGDCRVPAYHNVGLFGLTAGIASGINLKASSKYAFIQEMDLMQSYIPALSAYAGQCTYRHSLDALSQGAIDPPVVMVSGVMRGPLLSPEVELAPLYQMDGFNELPLNGSGAWAIVLRGSFGQELARHPFQPSFAVEGALLDEGYFNFTVNDHPDLQRVEIVAPRFRFGAPPEDTVLAFRDLTDHAPQLDAWATPVLFNRWLVQWQGTDLDGDSLLYTVLTSTDGEIFVPTEIFESTSTRLTLADPAGTLQQIKVIVTDGGRSTEQTIEL